MIHEWKATMPCMIMDSLVFNFSTSNELVLVLVLDSSFVV